MEMFSAEFIGLPSSKKASMSSEANASYLKHRMVNSIGFAEGAP